MSRLSRTISVQRLPGKDDECIAYPDRQSQTCETDGETDSAALEQLAQPASRAGSPCSEELVNRLTENDRLIGAPWARSK